MEVFADTSYFIALLFEDDDANEQAQAFTKTYTGTIVTTSGILVEVLDGLSSPRYRSDAVRFVDWIKAKQSIDVVTVDDELFEASFALYRSRRDKYWSLTDCASFVVMERRGLRDALTADIDFVQAGFRALLRV